MDDLTKLVSHTSVYTSNSLRMYKVIVANPEFSLKKATSAERYAQSY